MYQSEITFEQAAKSYLESGGDNRYLPLVMDHFKGRALRSIHPFDLREMATTLYPNQKNATRNRQAITPARAVIMHGYERGWCNYIRVRRFKEDAPKRREPPPAVWYHLFCRQCDKDGLQHVAAIVLFMAQTGARISEAVRLCWSEIDLRNRTAILLRTKTTTNSTRHLTDELISRLHELQEGQKPEDPAFRYTSRHGAAERIAAICDRAGIPRMSPHTCGRKAFATNAIDYGMDIPTVMAAADWKSPTVFLGTYVYLRRNAGRTAADCFNQHQFTSSM